MALSLVAITIIGEIQEHLEIRLIGLDPGQRDFKRCLIEVAREADSSQPQETIPTPRSLKTVTREESIDSVPYMKMPALAKASFKKPRLSPKESKSKCPNSNQAPSPTSTSSSSSTESTLTPSKQSRMKLETYS